MPLPLTERIITPDGEIVANPPVTLASGYTYTARLHMPWLLGTRPPEDESTPPTGQP